MRTDHDLYKLFRARLPIATLPKEFADRLTKAVLDEVAQLRQEQPLIPGCFERYPEESITLRALPKPTKPSSLSCSAKAVVFLLLLNLLFWPLAQGCAFAPIATPPQVLASTQLKEVDRQPFKLTLRYLAITQPSTRRMATLMSGHRSGRSLRLPPLAPIMPQLPILQFLKHPVVSRRQPAIIAPPSTNKARLNQQDPPNAAQQMHAAITTTLAYEQPASSQVAPPAPTEPPPVPPTPHHPASPATATATLAVDLPIIKPTVVQPTPMLSPTPILHIFEPTVMPTPTSEEPMGSATDEPTATPTICLSPWYTREAAPPSAATTNAPPSATSQP